MKPFLSSKYMAIALLISMPKAFAVDIDIPEDDPGLFLDMYLPYLALAAIVVAYFWLQKKNVKNRI